MNAERRSTSQIPDERRRAWLHGIGTLGLSALLPVGMLSKYTEGLAASPPPEIARIRLLHAPTICHAPQYLAEEFLRMEGFRTVEYVPYGARYIPEALSAGKADMSMWNVHELLRYVDEGRPLVMLAGMHAGCWQVISNPRVDAIQDLKGKVVAVTYPSSGDQLLLSSMLAYVGIDPREVSWLPGTTSMLDAMEVFARGKADAFVGFAQQPLELRARRIGKTLVNTTTDRPWSQYFCCMMAANRDFAQRYPIATKRALRAILKAADLCDAAPARAARFLADRLYEPRYEIGRELMESLPYNRWRESNPADTVRFYALRLHEVGLIKSTPEDLVTRGLDLQHLIALKRELKA